MRFCVRFLLAVEHHWTQAEVHGDASYVAELLLPDYRSVSADGVAHLRSAIVASAVRNGKSDTMARTVAAYMKAHPYGTSVSIEGDTGIVTFYSLKLGLMRGVMSSDIFVWTGDNPALLRRKRRVRNHRCTRVPRNFDAAIT
jgi:hypothetical protein